MPDNMDDESVAKWANAGVDIAEQTVRSWEAAAKNRRKPEIIEMGDRRREAR